MALKDEIEDGVDGYFEGTYTVNEGNVIPAVKDIPFGKEGRLLDIAMLFVDIHSSTDIVDAFRRQTAAKMYKAFLFGVVKIANANNGTVVSFNGDGVLVGFVGDNRATDAVQTALFLANFGNSILKPKLRVLFDQNQELMKREFSFGIGVGVGPVLVIRAGLRGENNNDLVWVGNATNQAAKLAGEADYPYNIRISWDTFMQMDDNRVRYGGNPPQDMWNFCWSAKLDAVAFHTSWFQWLPNGALRPPESFMALRRLLGP